MQSLSLSLIPFSVCNCSLVASLFDSTSSSSFSLFTLSSEARSYLLHPRAGAATLLFIATAKLIKSALLVLISAIDHNEISSRLESSLAYAAHLVFLELSLSLSLSHSTPNHQLTRSQIKIPERVVLNTQPLRHSTSLPTATISCLNESQSSRQLNKLVMILQ